MQQTKSAGVVNAGWWSVRSPRDPVGSRLVGEVGEVDTRAAKVGNGRGHIIMWQETTRAFQEYGELGFSTEDPPPLAGRRD